MWWTRPSSNTKTAVNPPPAEETTYQLLWTPYYRGSDTACGLSPSLGLSPCFTAAPHFWYPSVGERWDMAPKRDQEGAIAPIVWCVSCTQPKTSVRRDTRVVVTSAHRFALCVLWLIMSSWGTGRTLCHHLKYNNSNQDLFWVPTCLNRGSNEKSLVSAYIQM